MCFMFMCGTFGLKLILCLFNAGHNVASFVILCPPWCVGLGCCQYPEGTTGQKEDIKK